MVAVMCKRESGREMQGCRADVNACLRLSVSVCVSERLWLWQCPSLSLQCVCLSLYLCLRVCVCAHGCVRLSVFVSAPSSSNLYRGEWDGLVR